MLKVNENDIDVAEMLTQYVEDLENKTASLEDKILVQQKELRQKKLMLDQKEKILLEIQGDRDRRLLYLAKATKNYSELKTQRHMVRTSLNEEIIVSSRLSEQIQRLRRRRKKIKTIKPTVHRNCTYRLPDDSSIMPQRNSTPDELATRKGSLNSLVNQKDNQIRSIRARNEEIELIKLKLKEIGGNGKHNQTLYLESEIVALSNSISEWKKSCNDVIKKIREKRTS